MPNSSVSTSFELKGLDPYVSGLAKGEESLDKFAAAARAGAADLTKAAESVAPKATISKYWENEADRVKRSQEEITRGTQQLEAANARLADKEAARVAENARLREQAANVAPPVSPKAPLLLGDGFSPTGKYSDIGDGKLYGESKFNDTAQGYRKIADGAEKVGDAVSKSAEQVEKFNGKINKIRGFGAVFRELGLGINETEINVAITGYEKLTEYLAKNAAATKAAAAASTALSGAQAAATVATAGATTAVAAEGAAVAATGTTAVAATAAYTGFAAAVAASAAPLTLAAAGAAIVYHITSDIRNEAERRLREEEKIAVVYGQQVSKVKELNFEFAQQRANAARSDNFNNNLKNQSLEQLISRDKTLELLIKQKNDEITAFGNSEAGKISTNDAAEYQRELLANEQRIREIPREKLKAQGDAYEKQGELTRNSYEQARQYEDGKVRERNEFAKKRADNLDKVNAKTVELNDLLVSYAAKENPFVKNFNEIETATKRAQKQFGIFGDSVVNKIADIEKANLTKAINLQGFENNFSALTLRQQAQKLNATPENQFADFGRSTERISATAQSLATITKLQKEIDALTGGSLQSDIARSGIRREDRKFKEDFEDSQKGLESQLRDNSLRGLQNFESIGSYSGPNDLKRLLKDSSDEGLSKFLRSRANFVDFQEDKSFKDRADKEKINDALTQVADLKKISVEGAGINGAGIVSKQIADILGAVKDVRTTPEAAASIRGDLRKANQDLIQANKNELTDKLENLKFQDFGKIFARQQIDLINGSSITDDEKIKRRLSVTEALGNDLDPRLKEQRVRDLTREAQIKDDQQKEGLQISKDIKTLIEGVFAALTSDGIALDPASKKALKQAVDITVKDQTAAGAKAEQQTAAANPQNVEDYYRGGGSFNLIRR